MNFPVDYDSDEPHSIFNVPPRRSPFTAPPSWPKGVSTSTGQKEKLMANNALSTMMGGDKIMNRMFRKADGVVWDMMSGKVGVSTKDGIATFSGQGDDAEIEINMFDQFGMEIPAFAQSTPVASVAVGDLIYFGSTEKPGWVIDVKYGVKPTGSTTVAKSRSKTAAAPVAEEDKSNVQFVLMKTDGQRTTWKAPKVKMLGMGADGVMVIRSLLTMLPGGQAALSGMQNNLMMMMQMSAMSGDEGGFDMEAMIPMMLMGQMTGGDAGGGNNFMQAMLMAQMMKGGGGMFDKNAVMLHDGVRTLGHVAATECVKVRKFLDKESLEKGQDAVLVVHVPPIKSDNFNWSTSFNVKVVGIVYERIARKFAQTISRKDN